MKNILLLTGEDEGQESRLQAALDLTRALDGHLTCLHVGMAPFVSGGYYMAEGTSLIALDDELRESKSRSALKQRLEHEDVSWDWVDVNGDPAVCIEDVARLADLVVLSGKARSSSFPDIGTIASRAVMRIRKPIVTVPETQRRFGIERALIAWDGKEPIAATMRSCIPLLKLAKDVRLFTAYRVREAIDTDQAAEYLSRHGIHATINLRTETGHYGVSTLVEAECASWNPDYMLMGAYGHGRLAETFGGVTKHFLAQANVPLILGH